MDNLITIFMNYKIERLVNYGMFFLKDDNPFACDVFLSYFRTYIDNFYYGIFHTVDDEKFTYDNLKLEFSGVMEEMLYDYRVYELEVSNDIYQSNREMIRRLKDLSFELVKLDTLDIYSKDKLGEIVTEFVEKNAVLSTYSVDSLNPLIQMVRETYLQSKKLLEYEDKYFTLEEKHFMGRDDCVWIDMVPNIKMLEMYRRNLVRMVYEDEKLSADKVECLIQKISHWLLIKTLKKEEMKKIFIEIPSMYIKQGKIDKTILNLVNNPLFQKYVNFSISYTTYCDQKNSFSVDLPFACAQDFRNINDVYQTVSDISEEGFFHYLIVKDCRFEDRDFFLEYENEVIELMMFEEE